MGANFQDVLRDVHDPSTHSLKTTGSAAATIFAVVNTAAAGQASVVIDRGHSFIGLATVVQASSARTITGNLTLSNPNTYIGLTTSTLGVGTQFIGLATVVQASSARTITGNVTLSDAKTYVGLTTTTLGIGTQFIGLATVVQASTARSIVGNVTLTPAPGSDATVYAGVISSTGNSTLFVAPASNRFFIKDIHVSSLGRSEIQFLSGATILIPLTSLATTSGFAVYYGEVGKPARAQTDALVANLNGGATVSIGVTYRIAP